MKKLAYVITQSEMGGAQKNILLLCEGLKSSYEITVYSASGGDMIDILKEMDIRHKSIPNMVREISPLNDYKAYKYLKAEFLKEKFDIVHSHSSKAGVLAREAAKRAKTHNIVYTAHGFVFNEPMSKLKQIIYKIAEKREARFSDNIICVDPKDIIIAKDLGIIPKKELVYIPNGINFENDNNKMALKENDTFRFGLVANFYETKGHRYLIKAFKEILKTYPKCELVLIGEGILKEEMVSLSDGEDRIKFLGYKENGGELIKDFNCFTLSSVKEGFPFVILEAIKQKVPIISTDVGAIRDILKNDKYGLIIEKASIKEMQKAMEYVINNYEEAINKSDMAYDYCKSVYSLENMINLTKHIYEN
ncbi:glycosyltransferase family 4 protein [Clostridium algidicarnis]|uniref:glycosyltransferase family 4 protein n=1 Tax=Clostridium algidicarnis TaxID=37659 RepID=UPI001C0AB468|nr:glycosyltransferase family 4 protein [Clostridium algidicarnis]MBU3226927.1 glycosyltransferase family 4 protein [Clostridium algidicarnis]MBU3250162.1 glycosyltransferase family 4 protein [Clostridium algidicarnis]